MRTSTAGLVVMVFASCVGPEDTTPNDDSDPVIVCDAPMDSWAAVDLPAEREGMGITSTDTHLYVVGGYTPDGPTDEVWVGTPDGEGIAWSDGPKLPAAIEHAAVGIVGGRLWFLGGDDEDDGVSSQVFSAEVDGAEIGTWETGAPLDEPFTWAGYATVGDHLFVFGGTPLDGTAVRNVWRLDAGEGGDYSLVKQTRLPEGRFATSATTDGDHVYVVGGATSWYDSAGTVWRAPVEDGTVGDWEELAVFDDPLILPALTVTGDTLLAAAGASHWANEEARAWQISLTDGKVKRAPKLPEPRVGAGSARMGDRWVLVGGWADLSGVMHDTAAVTTVCPG